MKRFNDYTNPNLAEEVIGTALDVVLTEENTRDLNETALLVEGIDPRGVIAVNNLLAKYPSVTITEEESYKLYVLSLSEIVESRTEELPDNYWDDDNGTDNI